MSQNKQGRPTIYKLELAKEICDKIAANSKGIKRLCKENPHWPNKDTIFSWLKDNPDFSDQYARAKRCQVEVIVDDILDIADDSSCDQLNDKYNTEHITRSKLRIDTRKWLASKLVPKVYGGTRQDFDNNDDLQNELLELRATLDKKYKRDY